MLWCIDNAVFPKIVAMDPPFIDIESINKKLENITDALLFEIYSKFKKMSIDPTLFDITVFRPEGKRTHNKDHHCFGKVMMIFIITKRRIIHI